MSDSRRDPLDDAVERARAGDGSAFADLYRAFAPVVLSYLVQQCRRREDAEDLLGQVFIEAIRGIDRFEGESAGFRSWLFRIAHDRAVDLARRAARRPEEPLEAAGDPAAEQAVESEAIERLRVERLRRAVEQLPAAQKEVIALRLAGGLSASEIASVLGKQVNAVKALQHRALRNLASLLSDEAPQTGPGSVPGEGGAAL